MWTPPADEKIEGKGWQPPADEAINEHSVSGFVGNLGTDIKETGSGLLNLGKGLVTAPIDTAANVAKGIPSGLAHEWERLGGRELFSGHPLEAAKQFGQAAYEKPLTTGLDVAPLIPATKALRGLGVAEKVAPIAEEVAQAATKSIPSIVDETVSALGSKAKAAAKEPWGATKGYLANKYERVTKNPGWSDTTSKYLKEHAQNMNLKEMGAAPGQVRKIGIDRARELSDYANKNELVGPKIGSIGREEAIKERLDNFGGAVGAFRKMASERGAVQDVGSLVGEIRTQLDNKYLSEGMHKGQAKAYQNALSELKKAKPTAEGISEKVTEMFKEAKKQDRLKQPSGPLSDVARMARNKNHELIKKVLSPEEFKIYEDSLEHYGALTQIKEFVKRRNSTEAGGRLGPGSGISRMAVQKFLDSVGYRTQARIMNNLADWVKSNPELASSPKNMFKHLAEESADAIDELTDFER